MSIERFERLKNRIETLIRDRRLDQLLDYYELIVEEQARQHSHEANKLINLIRNFLIEQLQTVEEPEEAEEF